MGEVTALTSEGNDVIKESIIPAKASYSNVNPQMAGSSYQDELSESFQSFSKPFRTFEQQLQLLEGRGLLVPDRSFALECLSHVNYYHLEGYWYSYYKKDVSEHVFEAHTTFPAIWNDYCFDRDLRVLFFRAIDRIEVSFRTQFAYYLAKDFFVNGCYSEQLDQIFDLTLPPGAEGKTCLDKQIEGELHHSKEDFFKKFKEKYGEHTMPPPWIVVEMLSFGLLSKCYCKLKDVRLKKQISKVYDLQPHILSNWIYHLSVVRNVCAHHGRLWNRIIPVELRKPIKRRSHPIPSFFLLGDESDSLCNGKRPYNTILMIDDLLSFIDCNNTWRFQVKNLIHTYGVDVKRMGFPPNWESLPFWQQTNNRDTSDLKNQEGR
jgi:abortive infection bacteriophage resistance protein